MLVGFIESETIWDPSTSAQHICNKHTLVTEHICSIISQHKKQQNDRKVIFIINISRVTIIELRKFSD